MVSIIFICITLLSLLLFYYATGKDKRILFACVLWIFSLGIASYNGYFTNTLAKPPRFLLVPIGAILLSVYLFKKVNKKKLNTNFLLAIHTLRLPIELILYQLFLQKQVPILMTFKGWNFDIIMGITALCLLLYVLLTKRKLSKTFIVVWNLIGLVLLTTIVVIAILSSPLPIQQLAFDQPNIAVLKFSFIYLPTFIVPLVFLSHIITIKANIRD